MDIFHFNNNSILPREYEQNIQERRNLSVQDCWASNDNIHISFIGVVLTKTELKLRLDRATRWFAIEFKLRSCQCFH